MSKIITIDPISRIEGHLRVDIKVKDGRVIDAWSAGTMFRGIEQILVGKDPGEAWIFTQRFCGVCTTVHAMASVRAVENALDLAVPINAQMIRNMIVAAHSIFDHISHFYTLSALDWVDVTSAAKADPRAASKVAQMISPDWKGNSEAEFRAVKEKITGVLNSGQLGIFNNGYWGHKAMHLTPELNLMAVAHYLQSFEYLRKANDVVGLLGSKTPHIQNLAVGGVANAIDLNQETALNMTTLLKVKGYFDAVRDFVIQVYFPDVCAIMSQYMPWAGYGIGVTDMLAVPEFPMDTRGMEFLSLGGTLIDNKIKAIKGFGDKYIEQNVAESVAHSWYDGDWELHPYKETTEPSFTGFDHEGKYSWVKSPRFDGRRMQVGPAAQVLTSFKLGDPLTRKYTRLFVDNVNALGAATSVSSAADLDMNGFLNAVPSTMGRHGARVIRCAAILDLALTNWQKLVDNIGSGDLTVCNPPVYPKGEISGFGIHEAPRGFLSHWVVINNGKIANYQAVVPSTWNLCPRDKDGNPGPTEASLIGNPIADLHEPLEALRTVHSYDPCMACAVHAFDPKGNEIGKGKTRT
ncbi:nickel-dependent hydrogenase large subunit [Desulfatiferula olefinivorans]